MSLNGFPAFSKLVHDRLRALLVDNEVFESNVPTELLWLEYLESFPAGTNPIYLTNTEHDCNCCRHFIKGIGTLVRLNGNGLDTIWDTAAVQAPEPYRTVALALQKAIKNGGIKGIYRRTAANPSYGTESNVAKDDRGIPKRDVLGNMIVWNHFWSDSLPAHVMVADGEDVGRHQARMATFKRSCLELSAEAVRTVGTLIETNSIYRGTEFGGLVSSFAARQNDYLSDPSDNLAALVALRHPAVAAFRTTVIGTLAGDLTAGTDLDEAVRIYEAKVAPSNYRRTSAVVTPQMVKAALKTISDLGIDGALTRRTAKISDVSIRDVIWADGVARQLMKPASNLESLLMSSVKKKPVSIPNGASTTISLDQFVQHVLPSATGVEMLVKPGHLNNLMVLTAPVEDDSPNIFSWNNRFAWHYAGGVTDSIKQRVKEAGGNVEGEVRVSLSWFNTDDLDLHMYSGGRHVYFRNRTDLGAELDVDMNAFSTTRTPVENIYWKKAQDGVFKFKVHNFRLRERCDTGFSIQVEGFGATETFTYDKMVEDDSTVSCFDLIVRNGSIELKDVNPALKPENRTRTRWGLTSGDFVRVQTVMNSPNYWEGSAVGNKHVFFVIPDVACDEEVRGLYNEFLGSKFSLHRKVFELIGEKTRCTPAAGHMAGLGFSSTVPNTVDLRVRKSDGSTVMYTVNTQE